MSTALALKDDPGLTLCGVHLCDLYSVPFGSILGEGMQGSVIRVTKKASGQMMAMKVVRLKTLKRPFDRRCVLREARFLHELDSPFLCDLDAVFASDLHAVIMTDVCEGETLKSRAKAGKYRWERWAVERVFSQVFEALAYLHSMGIIHRDLKVCRLYD
jgi:serine/threonine-protein kinase